ncbi:MAG: hypothetical protein PHP42_01020 [Bacteroidota bacterium]|nr:hypothetical protein [Bacteroidota bacterium]
MKKLSMTAYSTIFFIILTYGIIVWNHALQLSDLRVTIIGLMLIGLIYYLEKMEHQRRLLHWDTIRSKGKIRFILYEYVLLRGGIVSLFIILVLSMKVTIGLLIIYSLLPLFGELVFAGNEVWKQCEEHYIISTLKSAAEKIKILNN